MRRSLLVVLAAAAALAPATSSQAAVPKLWATINTCDTLAHPDSIGIRASMPGQGRKRERMYMRFRVQYFRSADQMWHNISGRGGDSGFMPVGSATFQTRQAGVSFQIAPPAGGQWKLRGKVAFEWRRHGTVVRYEQRLTRAGHRSAAGSDPKGYSAATCIIS
jgi:hypothetical protein